MTKIQRIEINFPVAVEFPDGWDRMLDSLLGMVCKQYQKENPERVMWPAGYGAKPLWNDPPEPAFDDTIYCAEIAERDDLYGQNPYNPNREKLQEALRIKRAERKANRG